MTNALVTKALAKADSSEELSTFEMRALIGNLAALLRAEASRADKLAAELAEHKRNGVGLP